MPFDAISNKLPQTNLNIFIFIYFDTALEGSAYNYRDCCRQYLMLLSVPLSSRHAQVTLKISHVRILTFLFISYNIFKAFSNL